MRLFSALDFSDDLKIKFLSFCRGDVAFRFTKFHNFHLTLLFYGEIKGDLYYKIKDSLDEIDFGALELRATGLDLFEQKKEIVLHAKVELTPELKELHEQVLWKAQALNLPLEGKHFRPHVTLGRIKKTEEASVHRFLSEQSFKPFSFTCDKMALFSSVLTPEGSSYRVEAEYKAY